MSNEEMHKALTPKQINILEENYGCTAENWQQVKFKDTSKLDHIRNTHFMGQVTIGDLSGTAKSIHGKVKPCGIYNAIIMDCNIGDNVRIANIGAHIANYNIKNDVCIENVGTMETLPDATFGNGVSVDVLNESGGRKVIIFNELSSQFAYMMCLHRYRPKLIEKLKAIAEKYVDSVRSNCGTVSTGVSICSTLEILSVNIGGYATISNVSSLENGTILSTSDARTFIGAEVIAEDFIICENSKVTHGAILEKVFIGQNCEISKQYSAVNSLFFANCEAYHGEACSVFAGPHTVTHHTSSLLIAGLYSFYNAGSGTNQSNHLYKLGPVHEGKLLRGTKTGSFSYMMWPCRVGPFSVVLGKHTNSFDVGDFPFSLLMAGSNGKCYMIPGLNLATVGTIRDEAKWRNRDKRSDDCTKRDVISFDVLSPYTVGKMLKAQDILKELQQNTGKDIEEILVGGAMIKRILLHTCLKYYRTAIEMYLLEKVVEKAEQFYRSRTTPHRNIKEAFTDAYAVYSEEWVDIGGQLMGCKRLKNLQDYIEKDSNSDVEAFAKEITKIEQFYSFDEWTWVKETYKVVFDFDLDSATKHNIKNIAHKFFDLKKKFFRSIIGDGKKEFTANSSWYGFGQDGGEVDIEKDFIEVRGLFEENLFIKETKEAIEKLDIRCKWLEQNFAE